jgi:cobalt-zinc-cadmium efflux system outer membrane protein
MRIGTIGVALCAAVSLQADGAGAQTRSLSLAEVLARAREQAPQVVSARLALDEARGALSGASIKYQANPEFDAALGNRTGREGRYTEFDVGIAQTFDPGGGRSARVAGASAAIARDTANIDEVTRSVLHRAASSYYRALHANERSRLLAAAEELAAQIHAIADRRFQAGDIAVLDVNIARASLARIRAGREGTAASKALALGDLRQVLRLADGLQDIDVEGTLPRPMDADLAAALLSAAERPELRVLEAGIREAEALAQLGQSLAKPTYGVGVRYAREEGDQIVLGGMTVTLPVFSKGQEQQAAGGARAARLRMELDSARTVVQLEVRAAFDAYSRRAAAVRALEADAIPGLDENEQLTTRSFEVGQLGLPELLLIRREILDTRSQYLDALLEAALARIDLDASASLLR